MKKILFILYLICTSLLVGYTQETKPSNTQLQELVVEGKKVTIEEQGRNMTISNIKGSDLGAAGTILDMMAWTPGVMLDPNEQVKVIGSDGSPLIYINGIKQSDNTKLQLLASTMVKKIEIIRDPGSEYPTGTSCVIKITTSVPLKDIIGGSVIDQMTQRSRFSNNTTGNAFGSAGKFDFLASVGYSFGNSLQSASSTETIISKSGEILRDIATEHRDDIHSHRWSWMAGTTYHITKSDELSIEYSGTKSDLNRTFTNDRVTKVDGDATNVSFDSRNHGTGDKHTLLGTYIHEFDNSTLTVNANYNLRNSNSDEEVLLLPDGIHNQTNLKDSRSDLWTVQGDYAWSFKGKDKQSAGVYGGRSSNRSNNDYTFTGHQIVNSSVGWAEMYYSSRFELFKYAITLGVRGRYEKQSSVSNLNGSNEKYAKDYFNVVPNISIWHRFTKNFGMNVLYKYGYSLPSFSQLRPSMELNDLIFYETGNPELKIPRNHYLALVFNIKRLQLCAEYRYYRNQIMDITTPIDGTDYFLVMPINMSGCYNVGFEASYNLSIGKKFRLYAFGNVNRVHTEYLYADELVRRNHISTSIYINGSYNIRSNFSVFATAGYWSPRLFDNTHSDASCNISFGGNLSVMKSKLNLRLAVNDLLKRSVTPGWTSYSPNLMQSRINRYDTRGVTLTLTYRFAVRRQNYSKLDNADDYDRL